MRRLIIGLTVVVMVLLLASVAGAAPPKCDIDPNLPGCGGDDPPPPTSSTTTTTEAPPELGPCPDEMTIAGSGQAMFECLWRPVNDGSLEAKVMVSDIEGAISGPPTVFVRDDSPGDICLLTQNKTDWDEPNNGPDYVASFSLFYDEVPGPAPGDPDVLDYSAWLGHSYWDFVYDPLADPPMNEAGTHWCAPQDFVLDSLRYDTNGGALHVLVSFNAKKGGSLDVTLFPENSL